MSRHRDRGRRWRIELRNGPAENQRSVRLCEVSHCFWQSTFATQSCGGVAEVVESMIVRDEEVQTIGNCLDSHGLPLRIGVRAGRLLEVPARQSESLAAAVLVVSPVGKQCCATNVARKRQTHALRWLSSAAVCQWLWSNLHDLSYRRSNSEGVSSAAKLWQPVRSLAARGCEVQ